MKIYNDNIERSVGIDSVLGGEFIGSGYTSYIPPASGLIVQGNVGIGTFVPAGQLHVVTSLGTSVLFAGAGFVGINTTLTSPLGPETLIIKQPLNSNSFTLFNGIGNTNYYVQYILTNISTGNNASAAFVVQADTGSETNQYVNIGINNSRYLQTNAPSNIGTALDAYFYAISNGNVFVGNAATNTNLYFFAGGLNAYANTRMTILPAGQVGVGVTFPSSYFQVRSASLSSSVVKFEGISGTLFEVTDNLTGTLFSVNNISGIPNFWVTDGYSTPILNIKGGVGQTTNYLSVFSALNTSYATISSTATILNTVVGIFKAAPLAQLHIETNTAGNKGLYIAGAASQTANLVQVDATTSGTNYFVINQTGAVGINSATPAALTALDVIGAIHQSGGGIGNSWSQYLVTNSTPLNNTTMVNPGVLVFPWNWGMDLGYSTWRGTYSTRVFGGAAGYFEVASLAAGQLGFHTSFNTWIICNLANGFVGIATLYASSRLHLETAGAANKGLYIAGFAAQTSNLMQVDATTGGTNLFTITGIGSVGINSATPAYSATLDVIGAIHQSGGGIGNSFNQYLLTNSTPLLSQTMVNPGVMVYPWSYGMDLGYSTWRGRYNTRVFAAGSADFVVAAVTGGTLGFQTSFNEVIVANFTNRNVGINTLFPLYTFHVQGNTYHTGIVYDTNQSAGSKIGIQSQVLMSTGTATSWMPIRRNMVVPLLTAFTPTGVGIDTAVFIVPQDPIDGATTMQWSLKRVNVRVETTTLGGPAGISTIQLLKSVGTGAFAGGTMLTTPVTMAGVNEVASTVSNFTGFGATAQSQDKIAVQFTGVSTLHANFTVEVIMRESGS